jgi:hypothetical protein
VEFGVELCKASFGEALDCVVTIGTRTIVRHVGIFLFGVSSQWVVLARKVLIVGSEIGG